MVYKICYLDIFCQHIRYAKIDSNSDIIRNSKKTLLHISPKKSTELDFISAAHVLESGPDDENPGIGPGIYNLLDLNKQAFVDSTTPEMAEPQKKRGRDSASEIMRILRATLKNTAKFTDDQEMYLKNVLARLEEGALPKQTAKNTLKALNSLGEELLNPMMFLGTLHKHIPERLLQNHYAEHDPGITGRREIILSMYLSN